MRIRRVVTGTPLARQHERSLLQRGPRRGLAVPWKSFDRERYPEVALHLASDAHRMLALGEYTAVGLFARFVEGLAFHGAPFDLVSAATQVPGDEIRHADLAFRFATMCAGHDVEVDTSKIAEKREPLSLESLDFFAVDVIAIGETLACGLLGECRAGARDPVPTAILKNIVADEVHHARLGWYYLLWRAEHWSLAERQRVANQAAALVSQVEVRFSKGRDAPRGTQSAARALGVLDTARQRKVVREVMESEIVPGLDALGLGASHAWRGRRRIGS